MNLIHKAKEILETRGFAKGNLEDSFGRVCVAGALSCAATGQAKHYSFPFRTSPEWGIINTVAGDMFPDRMMHDMGGSVAVRLNNHPDTTKEDMVAVLDKAAVRFDEMEAAS